MECRRGTRGEWPGLARRIDAEDGCPAVASGSLLWLRAARVGCEVPGRVRQGLVCENNFPKSLRALPFSLHAISRAEKFAGQSWGRLKAKAHGSGGEGGLQGLPTRRARPPCRQGLARCRSREKMRFGGTPARCEGRAASPVHQSSFSSFSVRDATARAAWDRCPARVRGAPCGPWPLRASMSCRCRSCRSSRTPRPCPPAPAAD